MSWWRRLLCIGPGVCTLAVLLSGPVARGLPRSRVAADEPVPRTARAAAKPQPKAPGKTPAKALVKAPAKVPAKVPAKAPVRSSAAAGTVVGAAAGSRGAVSARTAATSARGRVASRLPIIALEHLTTHSAFRLRPDLPSGGFSAQQMRSLSTLLRCHHTGQRHPINRRLAEILYSTARHYRNAKLFIVAGYRAPRIAREKGNPKSPHKRGVACDFQVSGVAIEDVRDFLRGTFHNIGVGYYPNSGFIHVDVGRKRDAYWIDYSSPGQPSRYNAAESPTESRPDERPGPESDSDTKSE